MLDKINRMATQAKLSAEIALIKERISSLKRLWGQECFDLFETDVETCRAKHDAVKREIAANMAKLQQKEAEMRTPVVATPVQEPSVLEVTVPEGVASGQTITVTTPSGERSVQVVVPPNLRPGDIFHVHLT